MLEDRTKQIKGNPINMYGTNSLKHFYKYTI